jgi:uncharacterized protein
VALLVSKHEVPVEGLDPAHDGLTIAHITDVHVGLITPERRVRRAVDYANAYRPDLVLLTGDYVCYGKKFVSKMGDQLSGLEAKTAVVAVLGNHDHWTDETGCREVLTKNGYDVLQNRNVELRPRGAPLTVVGIDDAITKHHDIDRAFSGASKQGTRICLTHCPELADAAAERGAHLVVGGHTHGGQIHFKNFSERMYRRITKRRYLQGWYNVGGAMLYVNRGVGQSSIPIRAGEGGRSEVAIFTLRRAS